MVLQKLLSLTHAQKTYILK